MSESSQLKYLICTASFISLMANETPEIVYSVSDSNSFLGYFNYELFGGLINVPASALETFFLDLGLGFS